MSGGEVGPVEAADRDGVVEVWEAAVRATHHFLRAEDIESFRPLGREKYLDLVELACVRDGSGRVVGFVGVAVHMRLAGRPADGGGAG